jgi:hypothetical protein
MDFKERIKFYNFRKIIYLSSFVFSTCLGIAQSQNSISARSIPDHQKQRDDLIIRDFDWGTEASDLFERKTSPLLDLEVEFLGITPTQKEDLTPYSKKIALIYADLHNLDYASNDAQNDESAKEAIDRKNSLKSELKKVPVKLKNILGDEVYERYGDFLIWQYYNEADWGSEANKKELEWKAIEQSNDQVLNMGGILSPENRKEAMRLLYEDYKDFLDHRKKILSHPPPFSRPNVPVVDGRENFVQEFANNRSERKQAIQESLKNEKINNVCEKKLGFILDTP